jgi:glycosyltransferase involved in cell wall biosynthesis
MPDASGKITLGLSMIVKNESHVILRVLNSIYPYIDYWCIVDTGSTDGTQDLIKNFFAEKGIKGELIEMEWVDFSTCRNVALEGVEKVTDYGIWIDADEEFMPAPNFNIQIALATGLDTISVPTKYGGVEYTRKSIWKCGRDFKWTGPIHEILASPTEQQGAILHGAHVLVRAEGSSWSNVKQKYTDHALILEKYTEVDRDPRWVFYTAQSWRDAGEHLKSFEWYEKRSKMEGGFGEEVYFSLFMMARLAEIMQWDKAKVMALYNDAHKNDPMRGESLKHLVLYLHRIGDWETAYIYSKYGLRYNLKNPYPHRILFIDNQLYQYQMMEYHSISCFNTKRLEEGSAAYWQFRHQIPPGMISPEQEKIVRDNEKYFLPFEKVKHLIEIPQRPMPSTIPPAVSKGSMSQKKGSNFTPPKKKRKK